MPVAREHSRPARSIFRPLAPFARSLFCRGQGSSTMGTARDLYHAHVVTAALVFAQALPGGVEPGMDDSGSYAEWLSPRPGSGSSVGA